MSNKKGIGDVIAIVFSILFIAVLFLVFGIIFHFADVKIEDRIAETSGQNNFLLSELINKDVSYEDKVIKISDLIRISVKDKKEETYNILKTEVGKEFDNFEWLLKISSDKESKEIAKQGYEITPSWDPSWEKISKLNILGLEGQLELTLYRYNFEMAKLQQKMK